MTAGGAEAAPQIYSTNSHTITALPTAMTKKDEHVLPQPNDFKSTENILNDTEKVNAISYFQLVCLVRNIQ